MASEKKLPPASPFQVLLQKLVRVPKREIDEQEAKYQQQRERERATPKRKRA